MLAELRCTCVYLMYIKRNRNLKSDSISLYLKIPSGKDLLTSFHAFCSTVEPCLMATSVIWSPRYYGHFVLAQQNGHTISYQKPSLIWPLVNTGQRPHFKISNSIILHPINMATRAKFRKPKRL